MSDAPQTRAPHTYAHAPPLLPMASPKGQNVLHTHKQNIPVALASIPTLICYTIIYTDFGPEDRVTRIHK